MSYGKVTPRIVEELRGICGERNVIYEERDRLENYSHDEAGKFYSHMPDAVVKPATAEEIVEVMKLANRERIPVTPRGAGSGLSGACVPIYGGIVLSLERMNNILEIDKVDLVAVVEPGVVTNDLCRKVAEEGLFYAGYPMSVETSFIGGNVATNAGGSKVIKYGSTAHHVLGLEVVLPTGELVSFGGKRRKESSGYNFTRLFVGSEGTLGVFTKIYLNLIPHPGCVVDLLVPFASVEEAIYAVPKVMVESKTLPSSVEFIDRLSIELTTQYLRTSLPYQDRAEAYLIIQFDGRNRSELEGVYEKAGKVCLENGALEVFVADNPFNSETIWRVRRNWLEGLRAFDPYVGVGDMVVPTSEMPRMMEEIKRVSDRYGVRIPCAAHVGDGNVHPAPMKPEGMEPEEWRGLMERILDELALTACRLGGAPSGEHGIGFLKKRVLSEAKRRELELMRRVKEAIDPNWIMNPGKLF